MKILEIVLVDILEYLKQQVLMVTLTKVLGETTYGYAIHKDANLQISQELGRQ